MWGATLVVGLAMTSMPLVSLADVTPTPSPSSSSPSPSGGATQEPTPEATPSGSPSADPSATPSSSASAEPTQPTPSASESALSVESASPDAQVTPGNQVAPSNQESSKAPIAAIRAVASGTMTLASSPAGYPIGGKFVFSGTTAPGTRVAIWWDAQPSRGWRQFGSTTAGADGRYQLSLAIGSAAAFRFVATDGAAPGAAGWTSTVAYANAGASSVLRVGSAPAGFQVGSSYVFRGTATPGSKVTIFWDAQPYKGWRAFGSTTASGSGAFQITLPLNSASRFRFIATSGHQPGAGTNGAWESNPSYVNAVLYGTNPNALTVASSPAGFYVGHSYVFTGRTTPGMPVTIWWDAAPFKGWRVFSTLKAGSDGFYRVVLPIGSAGQFKFAASTGHSPDTRTADGWQTSAIGVTATVYTPPTMKLDPRCMTGRVICISRAQSELAWVVNGKIQFTLDARFGSAKLPTRNGAFKVTWKSRNHVSSIYGSAMPFSMFFDGGRAVHYSRSFAEFGYRGNSAGCVNTRDYELTGKLFDLVRPGDKVIVF